MTDNLSSEGSAFIVVALDGGAASGKSSTARRLAAQCHWLHVDTGSHYRAVAHACLEAGLEPKEGPGLTAFLHGLQLNSRIVGEQSRIELGEAGMPGESELRSEAVNRTVSLFAALPSVRERVKAYQQGQVELARQHRFHGLVMEGRDIGTVILPDAHLKVFLQADAGTREQRRALEGHVDQIAERDLRDSSRTTAPLRPAENALMIDTSHLSLDEVVARIREAAGA